MCEIKINGGRRLDGKIRVQGSKNSSLPILAATVLANGESVIHNCPELSDIDAASAILSSLGCKVSRDGDVLSVNSSCITENTISRDLMCEMRSSIIFMGSLLARTGEAKMSPPGGCDIGLRPIDLHISALRQMGAEICEEGGELICKSGSGLHGCGITLSFPSVGATENIMLSAVTAKGETTLVNAAREPEILDLAAFLNVCGARIHGAGENVMYIEGVQSLHASEHNVISDRIVAATYLAAAAVTGGRVLLDGAEKKHLNAVCGVFSEMGCEFEFGKNGFIVHAPKRLGKVGTVRTMPYPGFPTDAQAITMAALSVASGTSVIVENIFENRFRHVGELRRFGADIKVEGKVAVVEGVKSLSGTYVEAPDLRGGGALVVAGLAAEGTTNVGCLRHIDRGYEKIEENLRLIGAEIYRCEC